MSTLRRCPVGSLLFASVMAIASPTQAQRLGDEVDVTTPIIEATEGSQTQARVAVDGDGYLVLFRDRTVSDGQMRSVRLRGDGTLDREHSARIPVLVEDFACRGTECVGATREFSETLGTRLGAIRFRTDGTVVDAAPLPIASSMSTTYFYSAVEATPSGFLIAYAVNSPIEAESKVAVVPVSFATGSGDEVRLFEGYLGNGLGIGCGPSSCLVAWQEGAVRARRIGLDGTPLGTGAFVIAGAAETLWSLDVQHSGTDFAVVTHMSVTSPTRLTGWRVAYDETVGAPVDLGSLRFYSDVSLACDGTGTCLVEHALGSALDGVQIWSEAGTGLTFSSAPERSGGAPTIACASPGACLRVDDYPESTVRIDDLAIATLTATRRPSIGTGSDLQGWPVATAGGPGGGLVVFQRTSGTTYRTVSQVLDADGLPVAGTGRVLEGDSTPEVRFELVRAGDQYGLLSSDALTRFRRLRADGSLDGDVIDLAGSTQDAALAWNGTHFVAAWVDGSNAVQVQRLDAIGQRIDLSPRTVATARDIDLASDGTGFLLVYSLGGQLRAMRLDPALTVLDTGGILVRDRQTQAASVAFATGHYLVAWADTTGGFAPYEIRAARISASGSALDLGGRSIAVPIGPSVIDVAATSRTTYVAWEEVWNDDRRVSLVSVGFDGDVGAPIELARGPYNVAGTELRGVSIAGGPAPTVAYARRVFEADRAPGRIVVRTVRDDVLGASCTGAADCASGFCASGFCCEGACDRPCEACDSSGVCGPQPSGTECRAPSGSCDTAELCDGESATCPEPIDLECDGGAVDPTPDAGTAGGIDGGVAPPSSSGCAVAPGQTRHAAWLLLAIALLAARRVRRRRGQAHALGRAPRRAR